MENLIASRASVYPTPYGTDTIFHYESISWIWSLKALAFW